MLTRTGHILLAAGMVSFLITVAGPGAMASAQPAVDCPNGEVVVVNGEQVCFPRVSGTITPAGTPVAFDIPTGGGGGMQTECTRPIGGTPGSGPRTTRCHGPAGWYSYSWDCFFLVQDDPPADGMPGYEDHGDDGLVYRALCWSVTTNPHGLQDWYPPADAWIGQGTLVVLGEVPDGYGGTPSAIVELWVEAVNALGMQGPEITTAPPVDTAGLVRLPVWMWTETGGSVWPEEGQLTAAAEEPALNERVDAYAEPQHIEWDMGDGQDPQQCGPGVAWGPDSDIFEPPDGVCRHTYLRSSRTEPGGVFEIVAITTWLVWWEINGVYDNEIELQVGTTTTYQVDELQVLTTR